MKSILYCQMQISRLKNFKINLLVIILFLCFQTEAQISPRIGLSWSSLGSAEPISFQGIDGGPSYSSENYHVFGLVYIHPINDWLDVETVIEYSKFNLISASNYPPSISYHPFDVNTIGIPITIRAHFLKYLYVNTGILTAYELKGSDYLNNQSGIGAILGLGVQYHFGSGISAFINPYLKNHAIIPFKESSLRYRILESGFRFGLSYDL
ncbi:MAG: hypothetical protein J5I52_02685 [Saprospiraceae bacterium]|nr:MAG: hypothetical protein UZ09_BCD002001452 [Bacteroidetes bacterium OLB9]MCO6463036.1 hypothetical protein [Saprospiraceae bacterium]